MVIYSGLFGCDTLANDIGTPYWLSNQTLPPHTVKHLPSFLQQKNTMHLVKSQKTIRVMGSKMDI